MSRWVWNSSMSEDELDEIEVAMRAELKNLDYYSDEYAQLHSEHGEIVDLIISKRSGSLPKREHGWYLSNDD